MSDVELTSKLSLEEVQQTPEYERLTPKQRLWVSTYIASGMQLGNYDAILATRTAFACKSNENARIMSYAIMENIHIIEVMNIHFRLDPIAAFSKIIDRAIANKKTTMAQVQALKLKCELLFRPNKLPVLTGPTDSVVHLTQASENATILPAQPFERRKRGRPRKYPKKPPPKNQLEEEPSPFGFRRKSTE
jgi:hypothetical protein